MVAVNLAPPRAPSIVRWWRSQPRLIRFLTAHAFAGFAFGVVVFVGLLATDAWGLASLLGRARDAVTPGVLLACVFGGTFAAGFAATGALSIPAEDDGAE